MGGIPHVVDDCAVRPACDPVPSPIRPRRSPFVVLQHQCVVDWTLAPTRVFDCHDLRRGGRYPCGVVEDLVNALDLARWQFGITTVYHFLFVPLTIGLAFFVAVLETAWVRTRERTHLRLTKFFGTLFMINLAVGVVTGIVQEFQVGMTWSDDSRFFGALFGT